MPRRRITAAAISAAANSEMVFGSGTDVVPLPPVVITVPDTVRNSVVPGVSMSGLPLMTVPSGTMIERSAMFRKSKKSGRPDRHLAIATCR